MIDEKTPQISIVIPSYNEEHRLPKFLDEVIRFTSESRKKYEIIVVDDGSTDQTREVAISFSAGNKGLKVVSLTHNQGKGYAVKRGLYEARGNIRVFLDADGSVHPREIEKNLDYFDRGYDVIIGSRVLQGEGQILERKWLRIAMGIVFNFFVKHILGMPFLDTQCGFKMFRADVIKHVFARMYLHRFGFDVEMLFLVNKCGYKAVEVPVSWKHIPGSKINLITDTLAMLINVFQVRNWHWTPVNMKHKYLGPNEYLFMWKLEKSHWWFTARREVIKRLILKYNNGVGKILDSGCGTGANLEMLNDLGKAYGIDVSKQAVSFCKQRGLANVICTSLEPLPFKGKSFDTVLALDVLEHLEDPVSALTSLYQVMKPGAKIFVTVPAFKMLWSQHDEALCHFRRYSHEDLRMLLSECGFRCEHMGYLFFLSFFAVAPIRLIRRLFRTRGEWKSDTTTQPPPFLNHCLKIWFIWEYKLSRYIPLPFGSSIYGVASKP